MPLQGRRIILGVTGGIAAFKAILLLRLLTKAGAEVRVIMSRSARKFVGPLTFEALSNHPVAGDLWETGGEGGEGHIRLAEWAELIVVAPATANTLSKLAWGAADSMLTATLLSARSPVVVAPAMHTRMYDHPATQLNLEMLKQRGVHIVEPVEGELASGFGRGRLAEPEAILDAIEAVLTPKDLQDLHLLVTAGPTVESLDPVRFISNHSTGRMGYAIAHQARLRGATVYLVSGPTSLKPPPGVLLVPVRSADEMHTQVMRLYPEVNAVVMSAAVADYTPAQVATQKLKKSTEKLSIDLVPTVDILAALGRRRKEEASSSQPGPVLVGFAMETEALEAHARSKLERKGCDLIVANDLHEPGAGFGHDTNRVTVIDRTGAVDRWPLLSKREVGERLLDRIAGLQQGRSVEQ